MVDAWDAFPDAQQGNAADIWGAFPDAPKGFMQRVGNDISNDYSSAQNIVSKGDKGIANVTAPIEAGVKVAWSPINSIAKEAAGLVNPTLGKAANAIAPYVPGLSDYTSLVNTAAKASAPAAKYVADQYSQLPEPIHNLVNAAGTTLRGVGNVAAAEGMTNALRGGLNTASDALVNRAQSNAIAKRASPTQSLTLAEQADAAKAAASAAYESQANVPFSDVEHQTLRANLTGLIPKSDAAKRAMSATASGHINDLLQSLDTEPLTFEGAIAQRNSMNDSWRAATKAGRSTEAGQVTAIKDALDKTMINPETGTWQNANHDFGIASTKQDFADFIDVADGKAQPANSLDTMINNYKKGWQGKTLRPNERAILDQITSKSFGKEIKRNIAGRLTSAVATGVGAGVGGIPGAVVGDLVGTFASKYARDTAMLDKISALQDFFYELDKRPRPTVPQAAPPAPAPLQLTGPGAVQTVDSLGNVSRTPNPAHEIVKPKTGPITGTRGGQSLYDLQNPPQPEPLRLPAPGKMSAVPPSGAEIAQMNAEARLRNAARGNTEQPLMSGETIQMRPPNQMTIGAKGNLGTQLILKAKEMAAQGKSPLDIDQFIRTTLKNRQVK